jgi:rubrerythrin
MSLPLLKVALELEREGIKLYTDLSQEARGVGGRRTFLFLVRQEMDHLARIEKEIDKPTATGVKPLPDAPDLSAQYRARLMAALQEVKQRTRAAVTENTDQMRSLEIAAMMEEFLCGFYREAASETDSQRSKEFFLGMLRMERAHLDLLHGHMAHLEETGQLPTDKTWQTYIAP